MVNKHLAWKSYALNIGQRINLYQQLIYTTYTHNFNLINLEFANDLLIAHFLIRANLLQDALVQFLPRIILIA